MRFLISVASCSLLFTACAVDGTDTDTDPAAADSGSDAPVDVVKLSTATSIWGQLVAYGGRCLDDNNSATWDGNPIQIYDCTSAYNKIWQVQTKPGTSYVRSHVTMSYLEDIETTPSGPTTLGDHYDPNGQLLSFQNNDIRAVGNCIDVPYRNDSLVDMYPCIVNDTNQRFTYDEDLHRIQSDDGRCLAWVGSPHANAAVQIATCDIFAGTQNWGHAGDGHFTAQNSANAATGYCLEVVGGSTANNALLQLNTCHDGTPQRFSITGNIYNPAYNQCIGLPNSTTNPGNPDTSNHVRPLLQTCDAYAAAQRWALKWINGSFY